MENKDIRWIQRFNNFKKSLQKLAEAQKEYKEFGMKEIEKAGMIQYFEICYELAWKTLQDLLRDKGYTDIAGPNPVIQRAFKDGYIAEGALWSDMKKSRDNTSHTYEEEMANEIADDIAETYYDLLLQLETRLEVERQR